MSPTPAKVLRAKTLGPPPSCARLSTAAPGLLRSALSPQPASATWLHDPCHGTWHSLCPITTPGRGHKACATASRRTRTQHHHGNAVAPRSPGKPWSRSPRTWTLTRRLSWPPVVETRHSHNPMFTRVSGGTTNSKVVWFVTMMALLAWEAKRAARSSLPRSLSWSWSMRQGCAKLGAGELWGRASLGSMRSLGPGSWDIGMGSRGAAEQDRAGWEQGVTAWAGMVGGRGRGSLGSRHVAGQGSGEHLEQCPIDQAQLDAVPHGQRVPRDDAADHRLRAQVELQLRGQVDDLGDPVWGDTPALRAMPSCCFASHPPPASTGRLCSCPGPGLEPTLLQGLRTPQRCCVPPTVEPRPAAGVKPPQLLPSLPCRRGRQHKAGSAQPRGLDGCAGAALKPRCWGTAWGAGAWMTLPVFSQYCPCQPEGQTQPLKRLQVPPFWQRQSRAQSGP